MRHCRRAGLCAALVVTLGVAGLASPSSARADDGDTIVITSPAANATVAGAVDAEVSLETSSPVDSVDWTLGGSLMQTSDTAPYTVRLDSTQVSNGDQTLDAVANLDDGTTDQTSITVDVENPPALCDQDQVTVLAPASGAIVHGGTVRLAANVTNSNSPTESTRVMFFLDGTQLPVRALDTEGTHTFSQMWDSTTVANGSHALTAQPADGSDSCVGAESAPVSFTVRNVAPSISLTQPAAHATLSRTVSLAAATEPGSASRVSSVEFLVDGHQVAADRYAPFQVHVDTKRLANGPHTLSAQAVNSDGIATLSHPITVRVKNDHTRWGALHLKPSTGKPGTASTITAYLRDSTTNTSLAGVPTVLMARAGSTLRYHRVASKHTAGTGQVSFPVHPKINEHYQIRYAGHGPYEESTSQVARFFLHPDLSVRFTGGTTHPHQKVFFAVNARPHSKKLTVRIQVRRSSGWHTIGRLHRSSHLTRRFSIKFGETGTVNIRAIHHSDREYAGSHSNAITVTITKKPAPPPPTHHACTQTSTGSCIRGGEFCPQADYGQTGYDAEGRAWVCTGDRTHPHWE